MAVVLYCADNFAVNFAARVPPNGVAAPWLCTASVTGCLDSTAANFQSWATEHRASLCHYAGCIDTAARNFEATVSPHGWEGTGVATREHHSEPKHPPLSL